MITTAFPMRPERLQHLGIVTVGPGDVPIANLATATLHTMTVPQSSRFWLMGMFATAQPQNLPFDDDMRDIWLWIEQGSERVWPYTPGMNAIFGTTLAQYNIQGRAARQTRAGVEIPAMFWLEPGATYVWRCFNQSTIPVYASIGLDLVVQGLLQEENPGIPAGMDLKTFVTGTRHNPMAPAGAPFVQANAPGLAPQDGLYHNGQQIAPGVF